MKHVPAEAAPAAFLLLALTLVSLRSEAGSPPREASAGGRIAYPAARVEARADSLHGTVVKDPYRWLEDARSPEVKAWMDAEDSLARRTLSALPGRAALEKRLSELLYVDALYAPVKRGNRYFLSRRSAAQEKTVVSWRDGKEGVEKVLFDPNTWSKDGSASLGDWQPSWDGRHVAYQVHENNSDEATLFVIDVASSTRSAIDVIEGAKYASASWTPAGDGFYYTWLPTDPKIPVADRPGYAQVRFHRLGEEPARDRVVHPRTGDPTAFLSASLSRNGRWLVLSVLHGWTSADVYFQDLKAGDTSWRPLVVGTESHFSVEVFGDRFYVQTDDGAPRGRIFEVDPLRPARKAWREIVPERPGAALAGFSVVGGHLGLSYLKNASSRLELRGLDGSLLREIELPGIGSADGPWGQQDDDEVFYSFQSYTVPYEIWSSSVEKGGRDLFARLKVPVDPSPYTVEQVFYTSKDGTKVSMFLVHRKDLVRDGTSRLLLYGYGGFQSSETPVFSAALYPWLERGGIFALPNLRGGAEYGEDWHRDGMLLKKQNVFDDFIAAAEWLVKERYTSPDRLVIRGGSNGGLLVGAAMTQRPELFAAVLCGVPLLDMVRYHLFGSGKTWISEYGSAEDPAQFRALLAYSPYHRVRPGTRYPATLLLSADSDDRVDPMHARKFAALLQAESTGGPVLLRIEKNAGHGGADLIRSTVESRADEYAFALSVTGGN